MNRNPFIGNTRQEPSSTTSQFPLSPRGSNTNTVPRNNKRKKIIIWVGSAIIILGIIIGLIVGLIFSIPNRETDACKSIASKSVVDLNEGIDCYRSYSFNSLNAQNLIGQIKEFMELSSTIDFLKDNPEPHFNKKIDVLKDLDEIKSRNFESDFDFHQTLSKYFISLEEYHTAYQYKGYNTFKYQLPLMLIPFHQDNQIKLKTLAIISDSNLNKAWNAYGLNIESLSNDFVIEIEGKPAMEYIRKFADKFVGKSRDPNLRVSLSLSHTVNYYPDILIKPGLFTFPPITPDKPDITFTFQHNGIVTIPYLAINPGQFDDKDSFFNQYLSSDAKESTKNINLNIKISDSQPDISIIFLGKFIKIYRVEDAAVMAIMRFPFEENINDWVMELPNAIIKLQNSKLRKLVFDMSNNSGGIADFAVELLEYFFPQSRTEMFKSYITNKPNKITYSKKFKDELKEYPIETSTRLNTLRKLTYLIDTLPLSNDSRITVDSKWNNLRAITYFMRDNLPFPLNGIALISNSICLSACAIFSNWIQEKTNIPTYHIGKLLTEPATIGSGVGGSLADLGLTKKSSNEFKSTTQSLLPNNVDLKFPFIGLYSLNKPQQSLDFTWLPAKHQIGITFEHYTDPKPIWTQIIRNLSPY